MRAANLMVAVAFVVGCSAADGAPQLRLDRTACARCGMLVSELAGAAAYRTASGETRAYDDLACLLDDLSEGVGRDVDPATIWVYDRLSGEPVRASEATFLHSSQWLTPMGGGLAAFADPAAAAANAESSGSEAQRWADLVSRSAQVLAREVER
ncbi:MAG TPA: nitrous oxide reductase accessory protein NosL [Thermoanaerobaculia bacterium]|nr:nitrous oxide reductase accessory protein NosL [Thermoanaerobaculia bacterium]